MPVEPVWLDKALMLALYDDDVVASGGAAGLRDEGLLELAATYAVGIASNHPFIDGNKRMAFIALGQFLEDNGIVLTASDDDATQIMLSVATGTTDIATLSDWLRTCTLRINRAP